MLLVIYMLAGTAACPRPLWFVDGLCYELTFQSKDGRRAESLHCEVYRL